MTEISRETKQDLFIRTCRDSGFRLDAIDAAIITANAIGCHPLEIWTAMPSLSVMEKIAKGNHPVLEEVK